MAKADEDVALLVPQAKGEGMEARQQRDRLDRIEERVRLVAFLEMVVRNARAEVMNVMKPDIAGKPLQDSRQLVERASLQRRRRVVPILGARPIGAVELMLHVE